MENVTKVFSFGERPTFTYKGRRRSSVKSAAASIAIPTWDSELTFWNSGEWQVVEERLNDMDEAEEVYCPKREDLFAALDACPLHTCKVMIVGQDPYPTPIHSTGIAFSTWSEIKTFPITLTRFIDEYISDTGYPKPVSGDLSLWCKRGVLLWNALPTCKAHESQSHDWVEWHLLTEQIIKLLYRQGIVFAFLGSVARKFAHLVPLDNNLPWKSSQRIETSHPSPRGSLNSNVPFVGSKLFTRINEKLEYLGREPVNWRLR